MKQPTWLFLAVGHLFAPAQAQGVMLTVPV